MNDPYGHPAGPNPSFPPEYPYGTPAPGGPESLVSEPGSAQAAPYRAVPGGAVPGGAVPDQPVYPVPLPPEVVRLRAHATAALIVSILLTVPCFDVIVVPAIVTAAIARKQVLGNVPLARILVRVSWIWIAVSVVLAVAFVIWSAATAPPAPTHR